MTRTRIAILALATAATIGLTGCGAAQAPADFGPETAALQMVGFEAGLEGPAPTASSDTDREHRRPGVRKFLRKNTLHGEVTVQGEEGPRTVVVQRGTVTAADGKTIAVKSSDGFELTWTVGDELRVRQDKKKADPSTIKAGVEIGVAGARDGATTTARLVVVK